MKRFTSILFVGLFLMYHVGYLAIYWYQSQQIQSNWLSTVEISPNAKVIAVPISLPYWNDQSTFRPAHGKIHIDGTPYQKVLQRYSKDVLYLVVVADTATQQLNASVAELMGMMCDTSGETPGETFIKHFIQDYLPNAHELAVFPAYDLLKLHYNLFDEPLLLRAEDISTPPPQG